jgi:hypothetical protein
MMSRMPPAVVAMVAAVSGIVLALEVRAGADRVAFPQNYATGVMYLSVDKPQTKQVHQIHAMPQAFEAARKGEPMPTGTVFTTVVYAAKLDAEGNPVKDADGHFVKGDILAYNVMAKGSGWGSEYPPELRNGEWEYRVFTAEKAPKEAINLTACFQCHKPQANQDFVFSYDKLKSAGR